MFKNYLKIAFRNFIKQKIYSVITIFGLTIGIACCLLILFYVKHELSYDKFYPNADKIYRVAHKVIRPQGTSLVACTPTPLAPALKEEYPEIEHITRIYFDDEALFEHGDRRIYEYDNVIYADPGFFNVFPFRILKGDPSYLLDAPDSIVVTASMAQKYFGSEEALGKRLRTGLGIEGTIIGVTKDFHISSFHNEIEPLVFLCDPEYFMTMAIKMKPDNIPRTLSSIEKTITKFIPEYPFTYTFLDEDINEHYRGEEQAARIVRTFSAIAVFIACLGLFGLAAFSAERSTKEVGIRKVLGATTSNLVFHLSTEFTKWVLLANVIAWPVAYYVMNRWLENFAYRIHIGVLAFILAAGLAFVIALFTVSYQAIKAALANPIDALRYE